MLKGSVGYLQKAVKGRKSYIPSPPAPLFADRKGNAVSHEIVGYKLYRTVLSG
jgi:hypothetical protein